MHASSPPPTDSRSVAPKVASTSPEAAATGPRAGAGWRWASLVIVGLAVAGFFVFRGPGAATGGGAGGATKRGGAPVPVLAAAAVKGDIGVYFTALGSVTPMSRVVVKSRVDGQLNRVLFAEGQFVKEGDLLAQIDARPFEVQVASAEGQLLRDSALLKNARLDRDRFAALLEQKGISQQVLFAQEATVANLEGTLKSDEALLNGAKLNLDYTRITAPVAGRVGLRQMDAGNFVRAADSVGLVTISQVQPITVVFTLAQDNLPPVLARLQAGEKLVVEAYDRERKAKLATGALLTVDNEIDPTTGTIKCKAVFGNESGTLFPNQFVNVRLLVETKSGVVLVPAAAIQRGAQQSTFVYLVGNAAPAEGAAAGAKPEKAVSIREVTLGVTESGMMQVLQGVQAGDVVVLEGVDRLQQGTKVAVKMMGEEGADSGKKSAKK